jgi:tetratricopeptide (TPR) repeat protein
MSQPVDAQELVNACRAAAERAHVDMALAGKALDTIGAGKTEDLYDLWAVIDEQIGKAETSDLREQLVGLRARFIDEAAASEIARLDKEFEQSAEAGWKAWLIAIARAISLFHLGFSLRLCEPGLPFRERERQRLDKLRIAIGRMKQARWPEAYDELDYLAGHKFLPKDIQARLLVALGQIQLFHFEKAGTAKELFDTAEKMSHDDPKLAAAQAIVLSAGGDYWAREQKDFEKAKGCYERALAIAPGIPHGYVGLGECCEKENQLEDAEGWYQKAIASAPGDSLGYGKLFDLYGRPEFFSKREATLPSILERNLAVDPDSEYERYVAFGYAYEQNQQFDKAHVWYAKAIALDETRPAGHLAVARCYEKEARKDEAAAAYKRAIDVAPECLDGYWGLAWLYDRQEKWQDALDVFRRAPQHPKEWAGMVQTSIGEMLARLQRYAEAEEILKRELQADKDNKVAKDVLHIIARGYSERGDRGEAARVYGEILEILGSSYQGEYHNRLGILNDYHDDVKAAEEYRQAIAAEPGNAVFHRNLAGAYRRLRDFQQAEQELNIARQIDEDTEKFNKEMALLRNAEGNAYFEQGKYQQAVERYGNAITKFNSEDDVLHANLGGAWEQIKEPGKRIEALDHAITAYRAADRIKPTEKYGSIIESLGRRKDVASRYGEKVLDWLPVVTPIAIEVASNLIPLVEGSTPNGLSEKLAKHINKMRDRVQKQFGVEIPGVRIRGNEADMPAGSYLIMLMEIPLVTGTVALDQRFFPGRQEDLASLGLTGEPATNPLTGGNGCWIEQEYWQKVETAALELWDVVEYMIMHLEAVVQRNLLVFLGHQEVANLLETKSFQATEKPHFPSARLTALTTVCKSLVAESVSIEPFQAIHALFERLYAERPDLQSIVESIRSMPELRPRLPGNDGQYTILPCGPRFEAEMHHALHPTESHAVLAIKPERCLTALDAVRKSVDSSSRVALCVTDPKLRPFVRCLIELEFPQVPVLSRPELRAGIDDSTAGMIELEEVAAESEPVRTSPRQPGAAGGELEDKATERQAEANDIAITVFLNEKALSPDMNIQPLTRISWN